MQYVIGILLGISISNLYWGIKFLKLSNKSENLYIEYAERIEKWRKLQEQINKMKTTNKKPKGTISCK